MPFGHGRPVCHPFSCRSWSPMGHKTLSVLACPWQSPGRRCTFASREHGRRLVELGGRIWRWDCLTYSGGRPLLLLWRQAQSVSLVVGHVCVVFPISFQMTQRNSIASTSNITCCAPTLHGNYAAPIGSPSSILDVGTGTGRWAREMAITFPNANVVGVDVNLSPDDGASSRRTDDLRPPNHTLYRATSSKV